MIVSKTVTKGIPKIKPRLEGNDRQEALSLLTEIIHKAYPEHTTKMVRDIETCVAASCKNDLFLYHKKINQLVHNLEQNGNYILHTYSTWEIPFLDNKALNQFTEAWYTKHDKRKEIQDFQSLMAATIDYLQSKQRDDNLFQYTSTRCRNRRCKSERVIKVERQLASGDEGATTIHECMDCGKRWRTR